MVTGTRTELKHDIGLTKATPRASPSGVSKADDDEGGARSGARSGVFDNHQIVFCKKNSSKKLSSPNNMTTKTLMDHFLKSNILFIEVEKAYFKT